MNWLVEPDSIVGLDHCLIYWCPEKIWDNAGCKVYRKDCYCHGISGYQNIPKE